MNINVLKRVAYLFISIILILALFEGVRDKIAGNVIFPMLYNIGVNTNNARLQLASGKVLQYVKRYDDAERIYTNIINDKSLSGQKKALERSYQYLGDALYKSGDYTNAVKAYYYTLKKNPANKPALLRFVRINMAYDNTEQVFPVIYSYIDQNKKDYTGYGELCGAYNRVGNYNMARLHCQLALKNNRHDARAHYDLAVAYYNIGFKKEAKEEYALAKKIRPSIKSREELESKLVEFKKQQKENQ